jgi:hypothetical protein
MWLAVGLAIGLTVLAVVRPKPGSRSTDTASASLKDDATKIEFLKRYLKLPSEIQAAEFHVKLQENNKGMIPGPPDFDVRAVVKVPPDKIGLWTAEMGAPKAEFDVAWAYQLLPKEDRWKINSPPTFYERDRVQVVTFAPEGIVFKRAWNP